MNMNLSLHGVVGIDIGDVRSIGQHGFYRTVTIRTADPNVVHQVSLHASTEASLMTQDELDTHIRTVDPLPEADQAELMAGDPGRNGEGVTAATVVNAMSTEPQMVKLRYGVVRHLIVHHDLREHADCHPDHWVVVEGKEIPVVLGNNGVWVES